MYMKHDIEQHLTNECNYVFLDTEINPANSMIKWPNDTNE